MSDATRVGATMPTVIYIAGSGRSGSTLVERAIGAIPRFVNVGEALDLYRGALTQNERCGCGLPLRDCELWSEAMGRVPVLGDDGEVSRMTRLQSSLIRQRNVPRMLVPHLGGGAFAAGVRQYAAGYRDIYAAVAAISDANTVVDASKWPVQAMALAKAGTDVRVIQVVRDPRGVAYSHSKTMVARPQSASGVMYSRGVLSAAARWTATQTQVDALRAAGVPTSTLSYEAFVVDPRSTVARALAELQVGVSDADLQHLRPRGADLPVSHGIAGNPSRFRSGAVDLRVDDDWRRRLTPVQQAAVMTLAAPHALRFRRTAAEATRSTSTGQGAIVTSSQPAAESAAQPVEWPLVSVVVPTRGRPDLVRASLAGVVAQDYPGELEILVVHDQEDEDPTLSVLGKDRRRIRITSNTRLPGLAGARNTGLGLVSGSIIASCDDDDVWHPTKLRKQVARLQSDPGLLVVGSGIRLLMPDDVTAVWPARSTSISHETLLRNRVKELHSSTLVMRREAFDRAGLYDETLPHGYGEDYDWVLRAAAVGRIGCVVEPLADINKRVASWYAGRSSNTLEALNAFLERHPEIRTSRRGYARMLGQMGFIESTMGRRRSGLRHAARGLTVWPVTPHVWLALVHISTGTDPATLLKWARRFGRGLS